MFLTCFLSLDVSSSICAAVFFSRVFPLRIQTKHTDSLASLNIIGLAITSQNTNKMIFVPHN